MVGRPSQRSLARCLFALTSQGSSYFDKFAGLVGAKLVSGCAVSVQMTDESASSGESDEVCVSCATAILTKYR